MLGSEPAATADEVMDRLAELIAEPPALPQVPVYALPDQAYLEATVLPLLLHGLEEVAVARPADPLAFLAAFLLSNNPQRGSHPLLGKEGQRTPLQEVPRRAAEIIANFSDAELPATANATR